MQTGVGDELETLAKAPDSRTTTSDSLLGLLTLGPMTGYEIRQLISKSIGNFWKESFGQIYPALKRMEAAGLVQGEARQTEGRPQSKVYRLTEQGRDRLMDWLAAPARTQVPRNELLLKLFFGHELGPERAAEHLRRFVAEQTRVYRRFLAIQSMLETEQANTPAMPYWRLTVRYGLREAEAALRWAEDALGEMEQMGSTTEEPDQGGRDAR